MHLASLAGHLLHLERNLYALLCAQWEDSTWRFKWVRGNVCELRSGKRAMVQAVQLVRRS